MIPTQLSQLYPPNTPNTPMSEVDPDFRGMSLLLWRQLKISEQAEHWRKKQQGKPALPQKWRERAPATARDRYGLKGI